MIVSSTSIKIDIYLAVANGLDKLVLVESGELEDVVVEEVFFAVLCLALTFDVSTDIEAVLELGAGFVEEVVEAPIGYDVEVTKKIGRAHV